MTDPKKDRDTLPEQSLREQQDPVEEMRRRNRHRRHTDRDLRPNRDRAGYETK